MAKYFKTETKDGKTTEAFVGVLSKLLEEHVIGALLVPQKLNQTVVHSLIREPSKLESAEPLAPVVPVNASKLVSQLSGRNSGEKVGVVLRPCEIRSLVELVKLNQASLDDLVVIGMDCRGAYTVNKYAGFMERIGNDKSPGDQFLAARKSGDEDPDLRSACQICANFTPENSDLAFLVYGTDFEKEIFLRANDSLSGEI